MHEIHPNLLWVGHAFDIREPVALYDAGISAVIDVAYEEPPSLMPREFTYCRFPLNDGGGNNQFMLYQALRTTTDLLKSDTRTIIACSAGMSRSPTVAAFALAYHLGEEPENVITRIAEIKSLEVKDALWSDVASAFASL